MTFLKLEHIGGAKKETEFKVKAQIENWVKSYETFIATSSYAWYVTGAHTWYRMRGCVVHRGIKNAGWELSWCKPNPENDQPLLPC